MDLYELGRRHQQQEETLAAALLAIESLADRVESMSENQVRLSASLDEKSLALENSGWTFLDAGPAPHHPGDRGRPTGPDGKWWWDYGTRFDGRIVYGPYIDIGPGAYEYAFQVLYTMPVFTGGRDFNLFRLDAAANVGHEIGGSIAVASWSWFWNSTNNSMGTFDGWMSTTFSVDKPTKQVEFRLSNISNPPITFPHGRTIPGYPGQMQITVKQVAYRKIS